MESNSENNPSVLDFLCNERWPNELRRHVSQHLAAKDLLVCRIICRNWCYEVENEFYLKFLERPYLSDYADHSNGKYYQLYAGGGARLIKTRYQLQDNRTKESIFNGSLYIGRIDEDLGFYYTEIDATNDEEKIIELKWFLSGVALRFDCPYLAVPRQYFGDDRTFHVIFDDRFEELAHYIRSIPVEEYNEKLVTKLVTQLIHATQYLHDRNCCLLSRHGGIHLGIKKTPYGDIQLKVLNYTYDLMHDDVPLITYPHFLAPEGVTEKTVIKSDLFTVGSLALYLLKGTPLYDTHPMRSLFNIGKFQSYEILDPNNELSDLAKDFVLRLLKRNPEDRMTLEEALKHPWLTDPQPSSSPLRTSYENFAYVGDFE